MTRDAGLVAARVADEHEPVRGDRRHRHRHARYLHRDLVIPKRVAVLRVEREHVRVGRAPEQPPVRVRESAMHRERRRLLERPLDDPLRLAARRVDRVRARLRREVHRARDHDRSGLQRRHLGQRVAANRLQLRDVALVDLGERREAVARKRAVVGRPVAGRRLVRGRSCRVRLRRRGQRPRRAVAARSLAAAAASQHGDRQSCGPDDSLSHVPPSIEACVLVRSSSARRRQQIAPRLRQHVAAALQIAA